MHTHGVALRVREWRQQRGLSLRALAKEAGVSFTTVYRIEAGTISPTVAMLERLASALDVRVVDFFPVEPKRRRRAKR
jgi:transcriptional regulator with XRE-family HTH domain